MTATSENKIEDEWLIRPSYVYRDEYKDCITIKARLHQHFIFGASLDCNVWKRDYDNSCRWEERMDERSAKELIASEKNRRKERLTPHYNNTVWEKRKQPPENWNTPLPDYIQSEYQNSYLYSKSKEANGESSSKNTRENCVIM